jgi:hypothetical protein
MRLDVDCYVIRIVNDKEPTFIDIRQPVECSLFVELYPGKAAYVSRIALSKLLFATTVDPENAPESASIDLVW